MSRNILSVKIMGELQIARWNGIFNKKRVKLLSSPAQI